MLLFSTLLYVLVLGWTYGQTVSELCDKKQFSPFTYPSNRSVHYNQTTTLSDRFMREGWYGTLDFIIPSVEPAIGHCGTIYPIFLENEPVGTMVKENVTACIYDCTTTMVIKALKCSAQLTLYRLARPSASDAAYCLDGIESVLANFTPTVTVNTTIQKVTGSPNEREFRFNCFFPNPNRNSLVYKAIWYVDEVVVYESAYTDYNDGDENRSLTDTILIANNINKLGFQLHCDIRAAIDTDTDEERNSSLPSTSKKKFIGMEIENPVINIKEGEKATIRFRSAVPIGCSQSHGCKLSVTADISEEDKDEPCKPTATANGGCGISKKVSEWQRWQNFEITSTVTEDYGQTVTQKKVFLRTDDVYKSQPIWGNYFLEPVTINIAKDTSLIQGKECRIHSDPYLYDFYRSGEHSFRLAGTFYLLKLDNVEVQVEVIDCSGRLTGYCVCGVVVRVGRTAFMINRCNLGYWHIDYILCDDGGDILDVRKITEIQFEIYLPSDTKIKIHLREWSKYNWLNIYIYPSVRDIGKTSGLCGQLTADPPTVVYNDAYFNSSRVQNNKNLFDPDNWRTLPEWITNDSIKFQHCRCDQKKDGIKYTLNCTELVPSATTCSLETDYTLFHKKRCISPRRKKRSLPRGSQPQILHHQRLRRDVSWKNGWTMNSASEYCSGLFNNSMVIKRCKDINGINIEGAIETCVSDIQLSGTDVFALSSILSVSSQCLHEAKMNGTLREEKVDNGKTILEMVKEVTCPGECSDQGLCEDGKCICNSGYIGSDCSVSINTPPLAHSLEADGHCDLSEDDCTEVAVFGGRFVDAKQTKCKMVPFEIKNDQVTVRTETEIRTAVFESIGEVTCKLPSRKRRRRSVDVPVIDETVTGYKVSVSNNGHDYSQQLNFIIYNTECMNCNIENSNGMTCSFSPDHCIMNNICYGNGAIYDNGDREFTCRADSSGKDWFPSIDGSVKDNDIDEGIDVVVIGVSVAVVVVIIVVIVLIVVYLVRKRLMSKKFRLCQSTRNPTHDGTFADHTYDNPTFSNNTHVYETLKIN